MGIFTPRYLRDEKTGRLMEPGKFLQREARGWGDAFKSVGKELFGGGKQFVRENVDAVEELIGMPKNKKSSEYVTLTVKRQRRR